MNRLFVQQGHLVVGYTKYKVTQRLGFIHYLYIEPSYRSLGFAHQGLRDTETYIRANNPQVDTLRFVTNIDHYRNDFLQDLAFKHGYMPMSSSTVHFGYPLERVVFEKRINMHKTI